MPDAVFIVNSTRTRWNLPPECLTVDSPSHDRPTGIEGRKQSKRKDFLCHTQAWYKTWQCVYRERFDEKEFIIRKAFGWALREYGKNNQEDVKEFIEHKSEMSALSYQEGSRILVKQGVM